ncbi:MAG: Hsp20/alpha crystallin family protein [Pseudomonadota bacterium]
MVEKAHTAGWWPEFYQPLRSVSQKLADWIAPRSDASANSDCYEINVELPGVSPDDIDIAVHDNSLVVKGEKRSERVEDGADFYFSEREYGAFHRTFRLPPDADADDVDANYANGVLCLKIAKRQPVQSQGRKVEIRTS